MHRFRLHRLYLNCVVYVQDELDEPDQERDPGAGGGRKGGGIVGGSKGGGGKGGGTGGGSKGGGRKGGGTGGGSKGGGYVISMLCNAYTN